MSTAGRTDAEDADGAATVAAAIRDADLVRFVATTDGDALAAAGLLAAACAERGVDVPYHVGFADTRARVDEQLTSTDRDATSVTIGTSNAVGVAVDGPNPASLVAYDVARELGAVPDPATALAGAVSADIPPDGGPAAEAYEAASDRGLERRPGLAIPVEDPVDGLAHSTRFHAPFSGDVDAVESELEAVRNDQTDGDDSRRAIASLVAITVTGDEASTHAASALHHGLHPHVTGGTYRTIGGHADVFDALAARAPGLAVADALGSDVRESALETWRAHARAAHRAVRNAETARYSGLVVARVDDGPVRTVARLLRDFRTPEPTVLVAADEPGSLAIAGEDPTVGRALSTVLGQAAIDRGRHGWAHQPADAGDVDDVVEAVREALSS